MRSDDPSAVSVVRATRAGYLESPPFHPAEDYPEAPFREVASEPNPAYDAVRRAFAAAGWDRSRFGSPDWNPLGGWIRPGMRVMLKPNLVKESHPRDPDGWRYVMTHGSVVRAVADYVAIALGGRGSIWLADAPQTDSSWGGIVRVLALDRLAAFYGERGIDFELLDLRREEWTHADGVILSRRPKPEDPRGYVAYDLGDASEFHGHGGEGRYYGADYDTGEVNRHHRRGHHRYLLSGSAVHCDVFVNLPKLKTHKKAGITASLKNLVGINGEKNWLPHHTSGEPESGGDEFPEANLRRTLERAAKRPMRVLARNVPWLGPRLMLRAKGLGRIAFGDTESVVRSGNWWGNDTTWRMCLDLNKALLYGNPDGSMRDATRENRKAYLTVVDGIVGGEGRGPMNPDPVESGLLLVGSDPAAVDLACAMFMGFDPDRIPIVRQAFESRGWPVSAVPRGEVHTVSDVPRLRGLVERLDPSEFCAFSPHFGWSGKCEAGWRTR